MAELRYNPLLKDWTMVAANRQNRPDMPKDYCPFCPGSGKVPDVYDVYQYDNDFPALSPNPPVPDDVATDFYHTAESYGKCEVILYSPNHNTTMPQLPIANIRKVVDLWVERFQVLSQDPKHKYIFIFENRGPEVGVTMPHPHGQIYAHPYVPQKIRVELESSQEHFAHTGNCLICDINHEEQSFQLRMLVETDSFVSYIPYFTDYPFGVFISSKAHKGNILEFTDAERDDLAKVLKLVTAGMDALFEREFPYMMVLHQTPVNQKSPIAVTSSAGVAVDAAVALNAAVAVDATGAPQSAATQAPNPTGVGVESYYHFHIEFYPPLRAKDRVKYLASSETGAWAPCNPLTVENTAVQLRNAITKRKAELGLD